MYAYFVRNVLNVLSCHFAHFVFYNKDCMVPCLFSVTYDLHTAIYVFTSLL